MNNEYEEILYLADGSVRIPLKNILTKDHVVHPQMKVLKMENNNIDPLEIIDISDDGLHVYLKVKNIQSGKESELMQTLDRENKVYVWSIISMDYIHDWVTESIMMRMVVGNVE